MNRRDLIKNLSAGTLSLFVVPAALSSCEKDTVDPDGDNPPDDSILVIDLGAAQYSSLGDPGGFVKEGDIIIINTGNGYVALSSICTHQGCQVSYNSGTNELPCPCHGSVFSISGSVLEGPASSPLKKYDLSKAGDILTIDL